MLPAIPRSSTPSDPPVARHARAHPECGWEWNEALARFFYAEVCM